MPTRGFLLSVGLALALLFPGRSTVRAQEPEGAPSAPVVVGSSQGRFQVLTEQPRARLGLFLDANCAPADAEMVCQRPPVVVSVVEDGPAHRAGVRQQDTLIALDGSSLSTPEGRRSLQSLDPGTAVLLSLAGPEGRREVAVIPELRAPARVMQFEWQSPDSEGVREQIRMFRFPSEGFDGEFEFPFDSVVSEGSESAFVMFGPDSDGHLRVEIVGTDSAGFMSRVDPTTRETVTTGYVVESRELAKRLEEVRDRTLRIARVQLDSLVRLQSRDADVMIWSSPSTDGRSPVADEVTRYLRVPNAPGLESLLESNRRVAGAEFLALTPDLAEYFSGVQEGLLVLRVIPNTPASTLGLRDGDVVVEADGDPVNSIEVFRTRIFSVDPDGITVKWIRKGTESAGRLNTP